MFYDIKIPRDLLWKAIIESLTDDFFRFFFAARVHEIDFSKGFRFLEQELFKLFPEIAKNTKNRRVDKLIEVTLKSGEKHWVLVHVEVQGYEDPLFTQRMHTYFYRILDTYQRPITAIAILTDNSPNFHPKAHRLSFWGTEMIYEFNTYKLLEKTPEDFADHSNAFAIIMETAWYGLQQNKLNDEHLQELKIRLIRRFLSLNYSKERIQSALRFISFYTNFEKQEINLNFVKQVDTITKSNIMSLDEIILEQVKEQMEVHLREEITQEVTQQVKEEVTQQVKEEVTQQVKEEVTQQVKNRSLQDTVLKLQKNGFPNEQIAKILEIPLEKVTHLLMD